MISAEVQHYLGRARDFLAGMGLLKDDLSGYGYSASLLGIHGAISYCDALRVGLGCKGVTSEDHQAASGDLKTRLRDRKFGNTQGANRLERLLKLKARVAYASHSSGLNFSEIVEQAQRFAVWAEGAGRSLKLEGWRDE